MKVKKFIAPTMPEVMKQVRNELGNDAVILNSKVVQKGGFFGFFSKKNIEVIAAIDAQPPTRKPPMQRKLTSAETSNKIVKKEEKEESSHELAKEIQELKQLMKGFKAKKAGVNEQYPDVVNLVYSHLESQELSKEICDEMLEEMLHAYYKNEARTVETITKSIEQVFLQKLEQFSFGGIDFSKQYLNIVGPTGVGKTTTIAKIAALCVLKFKKKVAFITTDTYRIAAIEQLKTYAQILDVPVEVAYTIEDFENAKNKFAHYDLILIDTAGRNFRNKEYILDLKKIINFDTEMETLLVLSLTSKFSDMDVIVQQFSLLNIHRFIFTKVDETSSVGSMFNIMNKYKIGAAYLTNGQNVPDDILEATPISIVKTMFGVEDYEGSSRKFKA